VRHQQLAVVAATGGDGGLPVAGEVERPHRPRPRLEVLGHPVRRALTEAAEVKQRTALAVAQAVQRELDLVVAQDDGGAHRTASRNSSVSEAMRSGSSMWTKWPRSS